MLQAFQFSVYDPTWGLTVGYAIAGAGSVGLGCGTVCLAPGVWPGVSCLGCGWARSTEAGGRLDSSRAQTSKLLWPPADPGLTERKESDCHSREAVGITAVTQPLVPFSDTLLCLPAFLSSI